MTRRIVDGGQEAEILAFLAVNEFFLPAWIKLYSPVLEASAALRLPLNPMRISVVDLCLTLTLIIWMLVIVTAGAAEPDVSWWESSG